ncbi:MAG: GNAT family N-acetyltransferase [Trueperella sp.]|nr:GNAT family N-acetyltransferase [Trueperella sp.]
MKPLQLPEQIAGFELRVPPAGWAERIASFDQEIFGIDSWSAAIWRHELAAAGRTYLVLSEPPRPLQSVGTMVAVGGVGYGPEAEILTLAVKPSYRRRGIARELLATLIGLAVSQNSEEIFLEVRANDPGALSLYQQAGFTAVGQRKGYYSDADATIMRRTLNFGTKDSHNS